MPRGTRIAASVALGLGLAATAVGPAGAQSGPTVFGGAGIGADRLTYAGVTVPLTGGGPRGFALRGIVSASENKYRSGDIRIKSEQVRGEAAVLYQASGAWGYFDAGVGARYVDTDLSPDDPGNPNRGGQWDPVVSVSGESSSANPWQVAGFASYGFESEEYYARAELTRAVTPYVRLGAEAAFDGDPQYDRQRAGVVVAFGKADMQLRFSVGAADSKARDGAYATIGFRRSF